MTEATVEDLIANTIHCSLTTYPEGDGGANMDYSLIPRDQSLHIAQAILSDLAAGGFEIVKKAR